MAASIAFLVLSTIFLAYTNGANDIFKGVATLLGSGTIDYRRALAWGTVATLAGSLVAVWIGGDLVRSFGGKGLVPDAIAESNLFLLAVGLGAAITVLLATRLGFPISTTHAMTGALVGAGLLATGGSIEWSRLGGAFFLPLIVSPVLAVIGSVVLYPLFRFLRLRFGVTEESGITLVGAEELHAIPAGAVLPREALPGARFVPTEALASSVPSLLAGQEAVLVRRYQGAIVGLNAQQALNAAHFLSAGSVSFARGLNDAPKIVALLFASRALHLDIGLGLVAAAMATGGLLSAKRIAETMSTRITAMNSGQGFTANLVTSILVLGASRLGVPVSTTHVACGALFGIGAVNRQARWPVIAQISVAWVATLPVATACAAMVYALAELFVG
jgi:inorganic phosphate transporter, PiT family